MCDNQKEVFEKCEGFVPSRKRNVTATATTAVGGCQPSGRALPSIILGVHSSAADHVAAARAAHPVASLLNVALDGPTRVACAALASDPGAVVAKRGVALAEFRSLADRLENARSVWFGRLDAWNPARRLHLPLLQFLVTKFEYVDPGVVRAIAEGMPIGGPVPPSGALLPRACPAAVSLDDWRAGIAKRNREAIRRVEKDRNTPEGIACWSKSEKEIKAGWLSEPVPLTNELAETHQLTPRFGIFENRGKGERKVRVIDDLSASAVNDTLGMAETLEVRNKRVRGKFSKEISVG